MRTNKNRILLLLALFLFFGRMEGFAGETESEGLKPAPNIAFKDLDGNSFKLSDYRGKVVILNFWAVWCPPCRVEIPHLVSFKEKYSDKGLVIFGIALASGDNTKIRETALEFGINYPVVNFDDSSSIRKNFREVRMVPTSFLINKEGQIFKSYLGFASSTPVEMEEDIKTLLQP